MFSGCPGSSHVERKNVQMWGHAGNMSLTVVKTFEKCVCRKLETQSLESSVTRLESRLWGPRARFAAGLRCVTREGLKGSWNEETCRNNESIRLLVLMGSEDKQRLNAPFRPADFSPFFPNPKPVLAACWRSGSLFFSLLPLNNDETKPETGLANWGRRSWVEGNSPLFDASLDFQKVRDLFCLAPSRKMSPRNMFKHPMANRKKAATRVKSSTWCERIVAPMRHWKMPSGPSPKPRPRTGK